MCGIYGQFNFNSNLHLTTCLEKLQLLEHRGPDGFGYSFGNSGSEYIRTIINQQADQDEQAPVNFFLGHRRLSIIDISDSAFQPMLSADRQFIIIFNGEIYNYVELKEELHNLGHQFVTDHSDTEILLHAFMEWGEKCLERLIGMFAFAIFNRADNKIFIARDRIGQKPLYYLLSKEQFIFSSEIYPVLQHNGSKFNLNSTALKQYLTLGYIPAPATIYEHILKLPPASYAWIDLDKKNMTISRYWDVTITEDKSKSRQEWIKEVHDTIREAVRIRLRSDVPLGAFASGGIDSTLILKNISEVLNERVDAYAADFHDDEHSVKKYVDMVADKYRLNLNTHMIGLDVVNDFREIISVFDEPFDGGSAIAVYKLFGNAKGKKKVIITGDGGDELFAGYGRYKNLMYFRALHKILPIVFPEKILRLLKIDFASANNVLKNIKHLKFTNFIHRFDTRLLDLLKNHQGGGEDDIIPEKCKSFQSKGINLSIKDIQYMDLNTLLPDRMLYKLDRFSMHYGIEARSPLMDHRVVELAFKIPTKYNVTYKSMKDILKRILREDFNSSFLYRKKQGFGNPLFHWLRNEDSDVMLENLRDPENYIYKFLDYPKVTGMIDGKKSLNEHNSKNIWRLIVLAAYLEKNKVYLN